MKLSRRWLSQYVNLDGITDQDIFTRLTMTTAEFEEFELIRRHFQKVYIGYVEEAYPHPNSDKLSLTKVKVGNQIYQIVCGAKNVAAGQTVPVALEGTTLPGDMLIRVSEIRGQRSEGMICSKAELGLEDNSEGIWAMEGVQAAPGSTLAEALGMHEDTIYEIDNKSITHRPDLWNHVGFARELAAIYNSSFQPPMPPTIAQEPNPEIQISIENGDDCPRYCGLVVDNIQVTTSPPWLAQSLAAVGVRSINSIVDITNYVMLELGEPLHAFDRQKLTGNTVEIRKAKAGETITTLDSSVRKLTTEDIVIADGSGPIALAGVMGGEATEITNSTTTLFLEAANFRPARIRKTANRLSLRTDAALRFEKSLDPGIADTALFRAWQLILELNPKASCRNYVDAFPKPIQGIRLSVQHAFLEKRLGIQLEKERVLKILNDLSISTTIEKETYQIQIPTYRATKDLSIAEDIVEEIGRVTGYDNIPPQEPRVPVVPTPFLPMRRFEHDMRNILTGSCHADEVYLYSFYGPQLLEQMEMRNSRDLKLRNFLSDEMDRLRSDLMPGLVKAARDNLRYTKNFRIFEMGRTYHHQMTSDGALPAPLSREERHLGFIACEGEENQQPYYIGRSVAETILKDLHIQNIIFERDSGESKPYLHPGRSARIVWNSQAIGFVGELHPRVMQNFDITTRLVLVDLNIDSLFTAAQESSAHFQEPNRFPPAYLELSLLANQRDEVATMIQALQQGNLDYLARIDLLSIYTGEKLPAGKKSVSLGLTFQKEDGTLPAEVLKNLQEKSIQLLTKAGFPLR